MRLFEALQQNRGLRRLDLRGNTVGPASVDRLPALLQHNWTLGALELKYMDERTRMDVRQLLSADARRRRRPQPPAWCIQRLLWIAALKEDVQRAPIGMLPAELIRHVLHLCRALPSDWPAGFVASPPKRPPQS